MILNSTFLFGLSLNSFIFNSPLFSYPPNHLSASYFYQNLNFKKISNYVFYDQSLSNLTIYNSRFEHLLKRPISINQEDCTVMRGAIIGSQYQAKCFNATNCVFRNIESNTTGGAINAHNTQTTLIFLDRCVFISCSSKSDGGAVYFSTNPNRQGELIAISSFFTKCTIENIFDNKILCGGAIFCFGNKINVSNSTFTNCGINSVIGDCLGGAIYADVSNADKSFYFTVFKNCYASLRPIPTPLPTQTPTPVFTKSDVFTSSDEFTASITFTSSNKFSMSTVFSISKNFSKSNDFSKSQAFSYSDCFSQSSDFSSSDLFSFSSLFTYSKEFTISSQFTCSDYFSDSNHFSHSEYFTESTKFTLSDDFSESTEFTFSDLFTESTHFNLSEGFTKSVKFTYSNKFTESIKFTYSNKFTESIKFTYSNYYSNSDEFSYSDHFTHSNSFSMTANYTISDLDSEFSTDQVSSSEEEPSQDSSSSESAGNAYLLVESDQPNSNVVTSSNGGAVYLRLDGSGTTKRVEFYGCNFTNCTSSMGSAIYLPTETDLVINGSVFSNTRTVTNSIIYMDSETTDSTIFIKSLGISSITCDHFILSPNRKLIFLNKEVDSGQIYLEDFENDKNIFSYPPYEFFGLNFGNFEQMLFPTIQPEQSSSSNPTSNQTPTTLPLTPTSEVTTQTSPQTQTVTTPPQPVTTPDTPANYSPIEPQSPSSIIGSDNANGDGSVANNQKSGLSAVAIVFITLACLIFVIGVIVTIYLLYRTDFNCIRKNSVGSSFAYKTIEYF